MRRRPLLIRLAFGPVLLVLAVGMLLLSRTNSLPQQEIVTVPPALLTSSAADSDLQVVTVIDGKPGWQELLPGGRVMNVEVSKTSLYEDGKADHPQKVADIPDGSSCWLNGMNVYSDQYHLVCKEGTGWAFEYDGAVVKSPQIQCVTIESLSGQFIHEQDTIIDRLNTKPATRVTLPASYSKLKAGGFYDLFAPEASDVKAKRLDSEALFNGNYEVFFDSHVKEVQLVECTSSFDQTFYEGQYQQR